jgi:RNA recognition motif-containing protein
MRLFISDLNRFTTAAHIVALLLPFGLVKSAILVNNNKNGYSEGTALVEMDFDAGQSAIKQLNNRRFMNCFIKVEATSSAFKLG